MVNITITLYGRDTSCEELFDTDFEGSKISLQEAVKTALNDGKPLELKEDDGDTHVIPHAIISNCHFRFGNES